MCAIFDESTQKDSGKARKHMTKNKVAIQGMRGDVPFKKFSFPLDKQTLLGTIHCHATWRNSGKVEKRSRKKKINVKEREILEISEEFIRKILLFL